MILVSMLLSKDTTKRDDPTHPPGFEKYIDMPRNGLAS